MGGRTGDFRQYPELVLGDLVAVGLADEASGKLRVYALDFPDSPGIVREGTLFTLAMPERTAFETLKPAIANTSNPDDFGPEARAHLTSFLVPKTVCNIPLVSRGRALGLLKIGRTAERPYDADERGRERTPISSTCDQIAPSSRGRRNTLTITRIPKSVTSRRTGENFSMRPPCQTSIIQNCYGLLLCRASSASNM